MVRLLFYHMSFIEAHYLPFTGYGNSVIGNGELSQITFDLVYTLAKRPPIS
jgi:hypothetical protein